MAQVIPSVNCSNFECVADKFNRAKAFLPEDGWLHVDVADARFTYGRSWDNPLELKKLFDAGAKFNVEVHLMVEEPEKVVEDWLKAGAKRLIIHLETMQDGRVHSDGEVDQMTPLDYISHLAKKYGAEVMLAINPGTPVEMLKPFLKTFSFFQILAVIPGPAGQPILPIAYEKIKFLRANAPNAKIEVDGGINLETGKKAVAAGANILVAASHIFGSSDPKKAYTELSFL